MNLMGLGEIFFTDATIFSVNGANLSIDEEHAIGTNQCSDHAALAFERVELVRDFCCFDFDFAEILLRILSNG